MAAPEKRYFTQAKRDNMSRVKTEYWADKRRRFQMSVLYEVVEWLDRQKREGVSYIPIPVEGQMDPETRIIAKLKNARPGAPSLVVIIDGQTYFLLIKKENGKLSRAQLEIKEEIEAAGGKWAVAKGFAMATAQLVKWDAARPDKDAAQAIDALVSD